MIIKNIGTRGVIFTFSELKNTSEDCIVNVYVINGKKNFFICDTYMGPSYMRKIKEYLENMYGEKRYIVFNSHGHWDHIWGNVEFKDDIIISHEKCKDYIDEYGNEHYKMRVKDFEKEGIDFHIEDIEIAVPNLVFEDKLIFVDEGVEFFYSPGHSEDSATCYDSIDNILFTGDNVDNPIPYYMTWSNLDGYLATLENYLEIDADHIIISHGEVSQNDLVRSNIEYIEKLKIGRNLAFDDEESMKRHICNIECLKEN